MRPLEQAVARAAMPLYLEQNLTVPPMRSDSSFHPCHSVLILNRCGIHRLALAVRKHPPYALDVGLIHYQHAVKLALHTRCLLASKMTLHSLGVHDLACGGDLETPFRALMRFELDLVAHG